jgi:TRAP-type mannitol/chloroaromatic compound transport system substrate-binding protein
MSDRRRFLLTAGGTVAAATATAIVDAPHIIAQPKVQWRMSTAWPPVLDHLQGSRRPIGEGRRGDERWPVSDRGIPG